MQYDDVVNRIITVLQKPGLETLIRTKALTARKYHFVQYLCGAALLIVPVLALVVIKKAAKVGAVIQLVGSSVMSGLRAVVQTFYLNTAVQNVWIALTILVVLVKCLFYIHTWDLQYDEMWGYNYFTARPFYFTPFAYNNYPLFELSTHFFKLLPFSVKINLRLPVLVTGILSCLLLYACLRRYYRSHPAALGGLLVYAFMPVTTLYMLYARGVIFESFFAVAAIFSLLFWLQKEDKKYLVIFSLANALGMYSMPTHLYLWGMLFVVGLAACVRKKNALPFVTANGIALLLSFLLYLPVLLGSGVSFVAEAVVLQYSYSQIIPNIPAFVASYSSYYTGFRVGIVVILAVTTGYLLHRKEKRDPVVLPLVWMLCFFPLFAYVVQKMVVPYRASGFVALALPLFLSVTVQRLENRVNTRILYPCVLFIGATLLAVSHYCHDLNWSRLRDRQAIHLSELFMNRGVRNFYDNSDGSGFFYFYPALEYYYGLHGKKVDFSVAASNSIRFKPFNPAAGYDCIIYRLDAPAGSAPGQYKEVWTDPVLNYKVLMKREGD